MNGKCSVLVSMASVTLLLNIALTAYGNGFVMENLPPATLGERKASLFIQINPSILTVESVKNASVFLRLYDANTNQTIEHVSYFIKIEKAGEMLMQDLFHTHTGELKLKINPKQSTAKIFGDTEPILGAWIESGGQIVVEGPIFLEGGLYHFAIEIFGVDSDRNIFRPEDMPRFDSWLSVGDITENTVTYQQKKYTISIISYYDKIRDFAFDEKAGQVLYVMPFDWDISRLETNPVFVHEEIKVPRNFTLLASGEFTGTVNGKEIPSDAIIVDDSNSEFHVIHYMLDKEYILELAGAQEASPDNQFENDMVFTLSSANSGGAVSESGSQSSEPQAPESSSQMVATTPSGVKVKLSWNPSTIEPDKEVTFALKFFAKDGTALDGMYYDFMLIRAGTHLTHRSLQPISQGTSLEKVTFKQDQTGSVTLRLENINLTSGENVEFSIQVVPEFPFAVAIVMASVFAIMILVTYRYGKLLPKA